MTAIHVAGGDLVGLLQQRHLLLLGRVSSGDGGQIIIDKAEEVLRTEFPELKIQLRVPDEKTKRHGQAVAAASLPALS